MPIASSDLHLRLSGGAANSDPNLSIGGAKSSVQDAGTLFDNVSAAEATAGDVEYRCIYVHNAHATLTAQGTILWIPSNTSSGDTDVACVLGASAVGDTETAVADENTAPAGVGAFVAAATEGAALAIGDLAPGESKAVWFRRTVNAAAAVAADAWSYRVKCETAA